MFHSINAAWDRIGINFPSLGILKLTDGSNLMDSRPDAIYRSLQADLGPYLTNSPPVEVYQDGSPSYASAFAANHLIDNVLKKYVVSSGEADKRALDVFLASNKKCEGWTHPASSGSLSEGDTMLVNQFSKVLEDFFLVDLGNELDLDWCSILENARSGPGAAVGAEGNSFYAKHFSSRLTATSASLIRLYLAHASLYPEFSIAETIRQMDYGQIKQVEGSRISFAPKTADISRMICVEPIVNMYLQLGLGSLIEKRLRRFFSIDLAMQPSRNRALAKRGSETESGSIATIDLKSASDSISLGFLGAFVPLEWQSAILECRSPVTRAIGQDAIRLQMVSTMGNGFTFPLQTAIFASVVVACLSLDHPMESVRKCWTLDNPEGKWSVFGDDIIVDSSQYPRVVRLLSLLGFEVNTGKSFASGRFRESCGHDYYHGCNVRPVYVRRIKTDQDVASLINLFNEWSARSGIFLPTTVGTLWGFLKKKPPLVPFAENNDSGIRVPFALIGTLGKKLSKVSRDRNLQSYSYVRWQSKAPRIRISEGQIHVPRGFRHLAYNPPGLLQAYLRGEIRGGAITVRTNGPLPYDKKRSVTPYWDYVPKSVEAESYGLCFDKALWDIVTSTNLGHLVCS